MIPRHIDWMLKEIGVVPAKAPPPPPRPDPRTEPGIWYATEEDVPF